jgi:hypothetical protein
MQNYIQSSRPSYMLWNCQQKAIRKVWVEGVVMQRTPHRKHRSASKSRFRLALEEVSTGTF